MIRDQAMHVFLRFPSQEDWQAVWMTLNDPSKRANLAQNGFRELFKHLDTPLSLMYSMTDWNRFHLDGSNNCHT